MKPSVRAAARFPGSSAGHLSGVDLTNDLDQILLVAFGTLGAIVALLFFMAAIDPQTDRRRPAQPKPATVKAEKATSEGEAAPARHRAIGPE